MQAAKTAGLDADAAQEYLRSGDGVKTIEAEVKEYMTRYRVSGVPFFIVQVLDDASHGNSKEDADSDTKTGVISASAEGIVCGPDGVCEKPTAAATGESASQTPRTGGTQPKALTSPYTASGAQEVDYLVQLFEHLKEEAASK